MEKALPPSLEFYKYDGSLIVKLSDRDAGKEGIISAPMWRNFLHAELHRYAEELGIPIVFNTNVVDFTETDAQGIVTTAEGKKYEADIVVAADGISSKAANLIVEEQEAPTSSEYAIYRTSFPLGTTAPSQRFSNYFLTA
jgi:2-polyprenyl-6-methoxyphenol hydroxylase-like FAD-dependent oxidoreductase